VGEARSAVRRPKPVRPSAFFDRS